VQGDAARWFGAVEHFGAIGRAAADAVHLVCELLGDFLPAHAAPGVVFEVGEVNAFLDCRARFEARFQVGLEPGELAA